MFVSIHLENYRSFKAPSTFYMQAESICEFKHSLHHWKRNKTDEISTVPLHILIGDNNSGKTNLILAFQMLKYFFVNGDIRKLTSHDYVASKVGCPVVLGFSIILEDKFYEYEVQFMDGDSPKIIYEQFRVNRSVLFERKEKAVWIAKTSKSLVYFDTRQKGMIEQMEANAKTYPQDELYITGSFRYCLGYELVSPIVCFFKESVNIYEKVLCTNIYQYKTEITKFLYAIQYPANLYDHFLSDGTKQFFSLCDIVIDALVHGKVICIDGIDYGMQPLAVMMLTSLFHNPKYNSKGAQLIFTTHNPIFLDKDYIRRDEVTFFDKPKDTTELTRLLQYANRENNYMRKFISFEYKTIQNYDLSTFLPQNNKM